MGQGWVTMGQCHVTGVIGSILQGRWPPLRHYWSPSRSRYRQRWVGSRQFHWHTAGHAVISGTSLAGVSRWLLLLAQPSMGHAGCHTVAVITAAATPPLSANIIGWSLIHISVTLVIG